MQFACIFQSQLSPAAVAIHHLSSSRMMWNCALTPSPSCSSRRGCFHQLWFISILMSRQAGKSPPLVAPVFMPEKQKESQLLLPFVLLSKEKKRHIAVEHPAVLPIDPGVSPSLLHCRAAYAQKQVRLQSLRVSRSIGATCYISWNERFMSRIK